MAEILKWPALVFGLAVVVGFLVGTAVGSFLLVRSLWRRLSRREFAAFSAWIVLTFALALAATLVAVHRAVSLASGEQLSSRYLMTWGLEWGGAMILAAILGGLFVFRRSTSWQTVLTWPWLVGLVVGLAYDIGLSGQMDAGSTLCNSPNDCDTAWGLGAWLLGFVAAVVLGGVFVASATLTRLRHRRTEPSSGLI
jgi:hypothetical protein